jgi:hypothetical protein
MSADAFTGAAADLLTGRREAGKVGSWLLSRQAPESEPDRGDVEVHQKAGVKPGELQVCDHLSFVDREETLHGLQLDQNSFLDDQVEAVSAVQEYAFVLDRKRSLTLKAKAAQGQLVAEAYFVGGFEKARSKVAVDFNAGPDDLVRAIPKTSRLPAFL